MNLEISRQKRTGDFRESNTERMMTMSKTLITSRDDKGRGFIQKIEALFDKEKFNSDQVQNLHERGDELNPELRKLLRKYSTPKVFSLDDAFTVQVNYDETLEQKVEKLRALGFTYLNDSITTDHFPVPSGRRGTVTVSLRIPMLGKNASSETATAWLRGQQLDAIDPYILLDWIIQYRDQLEPFMKSGLWVVELAISWRSPHGNLYVVCLSCDGSSRRLYLGAVAGGWGDDCRFGGSQQVSA